MKNESKRLTTYGVRENGVIGEGSIGTDDLHASVCPPLQVLLIVSVKVDLKSCVIHHNSDLSLSVVNGLQDGLGTRILA